MSALIELVEPGPAAPEVAAGAPARTVAPPAPPVPNRLLGALGTVAWAAVGFGVLIGLWAAAAAWKPQVPGPAATFTELKHLLEDPFRDGLGNDKGVFIQLRGSLG